MCSLCSKYGANIKDEKILKKALNEAAGLLKMKLLPKQRDHVMAFIDGLMGENPVDRELEEAWEHNRGDA